MHTRIQYIVLIIRAYIFRVAFVYTSEVESQLMSLGLSNIHTVVRLWHCVISFLDGVGLKPGEPTVRG